MSGTTGERSPHWSPAVVDLADGTRVTASERVCARGFCGQRAYCDEADRCVESPAEPDAGDVEALAVLIASAAGLTVHPDDTDERCEPDPTDHTIAAALLASDWLDAVRRKAAEDRAEQIAQAIENERPEMGLHINVTDYRRGMEDGLIKAARIARGTR